jgi:predicted lipoprotein with Yx(FWY)xxD motif
MKKPATATASENPELGPRRTSRPVCRRPAATARGFTVYSFGPDTRTASHCTGQCAHFWPPVKGPAVAGPGIAGRLGTINRAGGSVQATYNGHPLYTYLADTAPGQAKGNGVTAAGGLWHDLPVAAAAAAAPRAPASSGGGGYGY